MSGFKNSVALSVTLVISFLLLCLPVQGEESKSFDSEKMISELEKQIEMSKGEWEKLKPVLEEKSKDLAQGLHESVGNGFAELEKLSEQFESMSKDVEQKVQTILSSEQAKKLRKFLSDIDQDAIREARDKVVADLSELLELTEEQAEKIKPVLEESVAKFNSMLRDMANDSTRNWNQFLEEFDQLTRDLADKLRSTLDDEQMQRLEKYNQDQKEQIKNSRITV